MPIVSTGQITIVDVNDGPNFYITNNGAVLPADAAGAVSSYAGAETQFKVVEAGVDTTNNWSFYVSATGGGVAYRDSDDTVDRTGTGVAGYLGGTNLLTWSEDFTNSNWLKIGATITSNSQAAPDGTTTGDVVSFSGAANDRVDQQTSILAVAGATYTYSVWLKGSGSVSITVNTTTGAGGSSEITIALTSTWTRYSVTHTFVAGATGNVRVHGAIIRSASTPTVHIWGAQLETGSAATSYTPTTSAPASGTPGYVKVVALTQDLSHLDITAVKGAQTVVRRFSVAKARAGAGGSPGTRGTITTSRAITGTAWSDTEANTAISNAGGGSPLQGDVVTLYNTGASFSATRVRSSGGTWSPLTAFFGGDVIVDNTLAASKIVANSITAGQIAAGAITTAKLLVVPVSLCPDPFFDDQAWWGGTLNDASGWFFEGGAFLGAKTRATLWSGHPTNVPGAARKHLWSSPLVPPAAGVAIRMRCRAVNLSNQGVHLVLRFMSATSVVLGDAVIDFPAFSETTDYSIQYVVPPNAAEMRFIIYNDAGTTFSGVCSVTGVMVDVAASADLIVDGTISAAKISAGAITTDKLLVTGRGTALNDDPFTSDASAWPSSGLWAATWTIATITDGPSGGKAIRSNSGAGNSYAASRQISFNPNKSYRVRCKARSVSANGTFYLVVDLRDSAGVVIGGDGTAWFYPASGVTVPGTWTDYEGRFGLGTSKTFPANARTMSVGALMNYNGTAGYHEVQDIRIEEMADASLIVDGAISATKLAANSIAVGTAAIETGAITNAMIQNLTIDGQAKIANGTIVTANIGDGEISNAKIGNFIQSTNYVAGTSGWHINKSGTAEFGAASIRGQLTASQINSNGLTIRDNSGNILFGVSNNIDSSRVNAASGWLNSNISIGSDGALSGAGGGQVSSTGLGITGLTLINDANCTQRGDTIQKVSGGLDWNAGMRSREAYSGGAFASVTTPSSNINAMFGLNSAAATSSYTDIDHAIYFNSAGQVFVYEEGASKGQYGNWSSGQTYTVQYDGTTVKYVRDGSVFYQRALTQIAPLFFDSSIATVGGQLLGVRFGPLSKTKGQNLLDTRTWVYGSSSAPAGFPQNTASSGGANYIEHDTLPDGSRGLLWRARSGSATTGNPEGGWDSDVFAIDHTKLYRFTVWIRCFGGNASGSFYLGVGANTVNDVGGGVNGNPYFFAQGRSSLIGGEWYLLAGYVLPSGYSGGQQNISGLYRATTGQRVSAGTDFRWISGQTTSAHRTYQFYTNQANNYQDFFDPRVELCDGTEPSLGELLAMGSPSARNQINASNASTYIASAAIGDAQIANTIQSTNYSGSAGWQINKGGTATFNEVALRGAINGGAFTGYAWPAVNNYGFHLGPNGLLLGNANNNRYFQVTSDGQVYAPGFTIVNGSATFSGTLSASIVNTDQIVGGAASGGSAATTTGASVSVAVSVPANASAILIEYYLGPTTYTSTGGGSKTDPGGFVTGPVLTGLTDNGVTTGSIIISPGAGTHTITVSRSYYTGTMRLGVLVLKR